MSAHLHLVFVLLDYFPFGGQQRDFMKIATAAMAAGHQVTALTHTWQGDVPDGMQVVSLPATGRSNHRRLHNFASAALHWCQHHAVDVRIGFLRMPGLDVYFAGDPCFRARSQGSYGRWIQWLPRYRTMAAMEQAVFAPTASTRILTLTVREQQIYQQCYDTPSARFTLLPPGVTGAFQPLSVQQRLSRRQAAGLRAQDRLLLMVGSHFRTKGVDRSLQALAALPPEQRNNCQLWLVGAGKSAPMEKLAARLGIAGQVHFLGGRSDVPELMQIADLLLQPSRTELAGMSIVEALCSNLPVLASGECGYAFHVAEAAAGQVLSVPFQQANFNLALRQLLTDAHLQQARTQASTYAASHDLRSLANVALAAIEASSKR
ncbi:glycosyltransferase family 4 protein [Permianibacter sp. IMCC34836]|uniref:glycosyltransferase family 4 protein n=1 Tax=Permianibacter fluminis TaxID=2738515 RepID=UPI0015552D19|nr:glycosyltransferase family 4 protein [Permianibacter fluminis]NQD35437.1 glycosyltransferase family 4 protein [Permianibacter fluminis]